jgi:glutathione S-transferase
MLILHHYPMSPFSEKIRLMLGYAGVPWQSLHSPEMPPRPNVDPLSGGYRRIPIAQIGADIFCDSRLICNEISASVKNNRLNPVFESATAPALEARLEYAGRLEGEVFWAAVLSIPAGRTLRQLLRNLGLWKTLRFLKDRAGMGRSAKMPVPSAEQAAQTFAEHLSELEQRLQESDFLFGEQPHHADFAAYHTLWFHRVPGDLPMPPNLPSVAAWYERMTAFGHGQVEEISQADAFAAARDTEPRPVSARRRRDPLIGKQVSINPSDYGLDGVQGVLVGSSPYRWIVERQTEEFGTLHVHFPKVGFELHLKD